MWPLEKWNLLNGIRNCLHKFIMTVAQIVINRSTLVVKVLHATEKISSISVFILFIEIVLCWLHCILLPIQNKRKFNINVYDVVLGRSIEVYVMYPHLNWVVIKMSLLCVSLCTFLENVSRWWCLWKLCSFVALATKECSIVHKQLVHTRTNKFGFLAHRKRKSLTK